jgi:hypothetical protein
MADGDRRDCCGAGRLATESGVSEAAMRIVWSVRIAPQLMDQ